MAVFGLNDGQVTPPQRVARGWAVATLSGRQDPYVPMFDEVKNRVREDVVNQKATELAKARADGIAAELKKAGDFAAAAKKMGLAVKTSELVARGAALPDVGVNEAADAAAFALPVGGVSNPIVTPSSTVILRVAERENVTEEQIAAGRDQLREELTSQRQDRLFNAYMQQAKSGLTIDIREPLLAQIVGR
jgi:parvulin-like peptidyl-prolyl isomerase